MKERDESLLHPAHHIIQTKDKLKHTFYNKINTQKEKYKDIMRHPLVFNILS